MVRKSAAKRSKATKVSETGGGGPSPKKTRVRAETPQQDDVKKTTETKSNTLKEQGNDHFKANRVEEALSCYIQALAGGGLNKPEMVVLYKNKVACFLKMGKNEEAIVDATKALEMSPKDPKALFRRCQAYENLGNIHKAFHDARDLCSNEKWKKSIEPTFHRLMKATGFMDLVEQGHLDHLDPEGAAAAAAECDAAAAASGVGETGKINNNDNASTGRQPLLKGISTASHGSKITSGVGTAITGQKMKKSAQDNDWANVAKLLNKIDNVTKLNEEVIREVMFYAVSIGNLFIVHKLYLLCAFFFNSSPCVKRTVEDNEEEGSVDFKIRMLHTAASKGFIDLLEFLVPLNELLIEKKDKDGNTLLHLCQSSISAVSITRFLLSYNVNVNIQNDNGETSLMKAIQNQNVKTMILLVEKGADFHLKDKEENTVFDIEETYGMERFLTTISYAKFEGHCPVTMAAMDRDLDILELLLRANHYPNETVLSSVVDPIVEDLYINKHPYSHSPFVGQDMEEKEYFTQEEKRVIDLLVRGGADIYKNPKVKNVQKPVKDCLRMSCPLIEAVSVADWYLVELMIQCQSFDSIVKNKEVFVRAYEIASNISIKHNFIYSVVTVPIEQLVEKEKLGVDEIEKIFYCSVKGGNDDMASALFGKIGNVDFKKIMEIGAKTGKPSVLVLLKKIINGEFEKQITENGLELLAEACNQDSSAMVKHLIELGVQTQDPDKSSLYQPIVKAKSAEVCELLLKAGVDLNSCHVTDSTTFGYAALERAVEINSIDMINVLLKFGAKVNTKLLCFALANDDWLVEESTLTFLEEFAKDLDLNYIDKKGRTMMSLAAKNERKAFVDSLIKLGATMEEEEEEEEFDVYVDEDEEQDERDAEEERERQHINYKPVPCSHCASSELFNNIFGLNLHIRKEHCTALPYGCEHCCDRFLRKAQMIEHSEKHVGAIVCHICSKTFTFKTIAPHRKEDHNIKKCRYCKKFVTLSQHYAHSCQCSYTNFW